MFNLLKDKLGVDATAAYPKVKGVLAALESTDAWKNYKGGLGYSKPISDAILDSYHS